MDDSEPLSYFFLSISNVDFGLSFWISIVILLLLLIASALVSGSEVAFFSLSPEDKEGIKEGNDPNSEVSIRLLNNPKDLLATILIVNNFVNVAIVILSSYIFSQIYPVDPNFVGVDYLRTIIEVGGITFVLLLIGEVIPKVYANKNSLKLVKLMSSALNTLGRRSEEHTSELQSRPHLV